MIFKENMIFQLKDTKYRIVGSNDLRTSIFIIEMCNKTRWPQSISIYELESLFENGEANQVEDNELINVNNNTITAEMIKKRDFYYEIVVFLIKNSPNNEIFYKNSRKATIDKTIGIYKISESSIKRIFCNYLKGGKIKDSLIPKTYNCGAKGQERVSKRNDLTIDHKIKGYFKRGINKYYNTPKKNNKKVCYELIIRDYLKDNPDSNIPSIKQFYYWFGKMTKENKRNEIAKRHGERIYQQKGRAIIGNSIEDALAPSELYQVDSTILDVYIVSKLNRNLIVSRPILYLCIDVYSRMIVGVNVTIEPFNSYQGVKGALINTMCDKVSYCKKFGIEIKKEEWDVSCVPSRILADRGELLSGNTENAISNLGILIQQTGSYRGDLKGIVEKSFDRVHAYIKPFVDGVVENKFNKVERGNADYRLDANLTLEEITQIVIRYVLFYNNNHVLNYYESDGLTIENNIPKIPNKIWEHGVKQKKGLLRELPEEVIKMNLFDNKEVTVTAKGVRFNKLYYVSKYTLEAGWYQRARIEGSFKVRVSYEPNDLSVIYYIKEDGITYDTLTLVTYMEHYKNMSEEEINKVLQYGDKLNKEASDKEILQKINLFNQIEEITNRAKKEQARVKDRSINKTERLRNIRENLEGEREYYRNNSDLYKELEVIDRTKDDELDIFDDVANEWGEDYE